MGWIGSAVRLLAGVQNPKISEILGFSNVWPEKPEILLSETRPDPDPNFQVRVFSRVLRVVTYPTMATNTVREEISRKGISHLLLLLLLPLRLLYLRAIVGRTVSIGSTVLLLLLLRPVLLLQHAGQVQQLTSHADTKVYYEMISTFTTIAIKIEVSHSWIEHLP